MHVPGAHIGKKRLTDPLEMVTDGCEAHCGFWELKPSLLQKPEVILATETSLQPYDRILKIKH